MKVQITQWKMGECPKIAPFSGINSKNSKKNFVGETSILSSYFWRFFGCRLTWCVPAAATATSPSWIWTRSQGEEISWRQAFFPPSLSIPCTPVPPTVVTLRGGKCYRGRYNNILTTNMDIYLWCCQMKFYYSEKFRSSQAYWYFGLLISNNLIFQRINLL